MPYVSAAGMSALSEARLWEALWRLSGPFGGGCTPSPAVFLPRGSHKLWPGVSRGGQNRPIVASAR